MAPPSSPPSGLPELWNRLHDVALSASSAPGVLEICGPPGSGKTTWLRALIASHVLPVRLGPLFVGGRCSKTLFVDQSQRFSALSLRALFTRALQQIVLLHLSSPSVSPPPPPLHLHWPYERWSRLIESAVDEALQRVLLLSCDRPSQTLSALRVCRRRLQLEGPPLSLSPSSSQGEGGGQDGQWWSSGDRQSRPFYHPPLHPAAPNLPPHATSAVSPTDTAAELPNRPLLLHVPLMPRALTDTCSFSNRQAAREWKPRFAFRPRDEDNVEDGDTDVAQAADGAGGGDRGSLFTLLIVDDLGAFRHQVRANQQKPSQSSPCASGANITSSSSSAMPGTSFNSQLALLLHSLLFDFGLSAVITRTASSASSSSFPLENSVSYDVSKAFREREFMPLSYTSMVTNRLLVQPSVHSFVQQERFQACFVPKDKNIKDGTPLMPTTFHYVCNEEGIHACI